ncbi:carboxyl transferase domain protein, partial [Leptospira interrogans serovar Bataviae str. HAI135]
MGGALVHSTISGVTDHYAEDDLHAIEITRNIVSTFHHAGNVAVKNSISWEEPLYPAEEIYGIIQKDIRKSYDVREIIARIVDGSRFQEFKKYYGTTLVTGFAKI